MTKKKYNGTLLVKYIEEEDAILVQSKANYEEEFGTVIKAKYKFCKDDTSSMALYLHHEVLCQVIAYAQMGYEIIRL